MKKEVPKNIELEQKILGSMLYEEEAVFAAIKVLKPEYFFDKRHQIIFRVMRDMHSSNTGIDSIALHECLKAENKLEESGGASYISKLCEDVWSAANIDYYCAVVVEKWVRRKGIDSARKLAEQCYSEADDTFEIIGGGIQMLEDTLADVEERNDSYNFYDWLPDLINEIAKERLNPELSDVLKMDEFARFNDATGGIGKSNLILISGKYKRGKTTLALGLALDIGVKQKLPVGIVSLEMDKKDELGKKLISMQTGTRYGYLRNPASKGKKGELHFGEDQLLRMSKDAQHDFFNTNLLISDEVMNEMQIKALIKYWVRKMGVKIVFVDYLQLIQSPRRFERQELEIAYMSRFFKLAAKDIGVPIVLIVQENEEGHLAYGKGPARDADFWFSVTKTIKEYPNKKFIEINDGGLTHKVENDESLFMVTLRESRHTQAGKSFLCKYHVNGNFRELNPAYEEEMPV